MEGKINLSFPDQAIIDLIEIPKNHQASIYRAERKVINGNYQNGTIEVSLNYRILIIPDEIELKV